MARPYSRNRFPRKITGEHTCNGRDREKKKKNPMLRSYEGLAFSWGLAYMHGPDEGSDITITTLCINQIKVHMFYIRFTCYIFRQTLLHNEFCVFSFAEVLAWAKEKRPNITNA